MPEHPLYGQSVSLEMPEIMVDDESMSVGDRIWLRADYRTRGQAQAFMAAEVGCRFTSLNVRREWIRRDGCYESEPGVPATVACRRGDVGAVAYWCGTLVKLS